MTFLELAKLRSSVRHFKNKVIDKEILVKILEAGRIAPSAANRQPWQFLVLQDKENIKLANVTYKRDWLKEAPVIIIICGDHTQSWVRMTDGKDHCDIDIAIAVDHMTLAASDLGLGTCWICAFDAKRASELFGLPSHIEPIVMLAVGYPVDQPDINRHDRLRKKFDEIVHWDYYLEKK